MPNHPEKTELELEKLRREIDELAPRERWGRILTAVLPTVLAIASFLWLINSGLIDIKRAKLELEVEEFKHEKRELKTENEVLRKERRELEGELGKLRAPSVSGITVHYRRLISGEAESRDLTGYIQGAGFGRSPGTVTIAPRLVRSDQQGAETPLGEYPAAIKSWEEKKVVFDLDSEIFERLEKDGVLVFYLRLTTIGGGETAWAQATRDTDLKVTKGKPNK